MVAKGEQQQLQPTAAGVSKPNRPPTEYEIRVYTVRDTQLLACPGAWST